MLHLSALQATMPSHMGRRSIWCAGPGNIAIHTFRPGSLSITAICMLSNETAAGRSARPCVRLHLREGQHAVHDQQHLTQHAPHENEHLNAGAHGAHDKMPETPTALQDRAPAQDLQHLGSVAPIMTRARSTMHIPDIQHVDMLCDWLVTYSTSGALCVWAASVAPASPQENGGTADGADQRAADVRHKEDSAQPKAVQDGEQSVVPVMQQVAGWQLDKFCQAQSLQLAQDCASSGEGEVLQILLCWSDGTMTVITTPLPVC